MNRLFVYGTLRRISNHPMQRYLAQHSSFLGEGTIRGEIYDLGRYPGVWIPNEGDGRVFGEVYELKDATAAEVWPALDTYEMCGPEDTEPHLYRRKIVEVKLSEGATVQAVVYVMNRFPIHARRIPGGDYFGK